MSNSEATTASEPAMQRAQLRAVSSRPSAIIWCAACLASAALLALVAIELQKLNVAPVLLLPLATGITLGLSVVGLARLLHFVPSRAAAVVVSLCCVLVNVASQDALAYLQHRRGYSAALDQQPKLALAQTVTGAFGPPDFVTFWRAQYARTAPLWLIDALLTTVACIAAAFIVRSRLSIPSHN
jgi:hypothetical protein